jgi:hypothetical protein
MRSPAEIRHEHYRELFLDARGNRGRIRGSLATPVAATAFTVFNLGTLAQSFDASRATEAVGVAIGLLATACVTLILAAVYCAVKVEWHFVHFEPPDLPEIVRVEEQIRAAHRDANDQPASRDAVSEELQNILTGSYYAGYEAYIIGNAESALYRMWALRLVLLALGCVAVAFLLLPFQGSGAISGR